MLSLVEAIALQTDNPTYINCFKDNNKGLNIPGFLGSTLVSIDFVCWMYMYDYWNKKNKKIKKCTPECNDRIITLRDGVYIYTNHNLRC